MGRQGRSAWQCQASQVASAVRPRACRYGVCDRSIVRQTSVRSRRSLAQIAGIRFFMVKSTNRSRCSLVNGSAVTSNASGRCLDSAAKLASRPSRSRAPESTARHHHLQQLQPRSSHERQRLLFDCEPLHVRPIPFCITLGKANCFLGELLSTDVTSRKTDHRRRAQHLRANVFGILKRQSPIQQKTHVVKSIALKNSFHVARIEGFYDDLNTSRLRFRLRPPLDHNYYELGC